MVVTEEDARGMWCPMVRVSGDGDNAAENRDCWKGFVRGFDPPISWNACIGSKCMMWAWDGTTIEGAVGSCGLARKQ